MGLIDYIKDLFGSSEPFVEEAEVIKTSPDVKMDNLFTCHHCGYTFEVYSKNIFPTSQRVLIEQYFVQGKGVTCPVCLKDSIF
jgi:transposase-like protein